MNKFFEIRLSYECYDGGFSGSFSGSKVYTDNNISNFETVEEIIASVQKSLKKRNAKIEFSGFDGDDFGNVLFYRAIATGMHDAQLDWITFWNGCGSMTNGELKNLPAVNKKNVKDMVLKAIKAYREYCET